ncbi:SusC/RagA family TonB-linked outer membrane protein [Pedobacter sp. MC2016-14]|uniref:SusC/RagA family TonB-linked outer membrane protein n=1 Tax=Pedobacter sp. MC2016-14 TaxID=2897327 RepID=UPI001E61D0B7|nr:SusC/RagA family TonB-linked outer membrane protein [Pedobacter sp. MC2016-14]MCD0490338.1 SusC/RagA family TonB-linked outer membrane protein [Pedobacter sp. MC2016-14]
MIKTLLYTFLTLQVAAVSAQVKAIKTNVPDNKIVRSDTLPKQLIPLGYNFLAPNRISGAVASVKAPALQNMLVPNFQTALQGQVAGLHVIQANGQPATDVVMRLRGTSSIYAETQPLFVIDGVPVYSGPREHETKGIAAGWGTTFNPLSDLDLDNIQSVEVLKDAASTAIYGTRGGNGVILVTTKKSEKDKSAINIDHYQGITQATNRINSLNGSQYLQQLDRAWVNSGNAGQAALPAVPAFSRAEAEATNTNNLDQILDHGRMEQLNFSTSYGSSKSSFYLSGNYHKEKGIITGNDLSRYSGRVGISNQISKRLNIGVSTAISFIDYNSMPVGYGSGGGFNAAQANLPIYPFYNPNGTYFYAINPAVLNLPGTNVAAFQSKRDFDNKETTRRVTAGANLTYLLANGLDLRIDGAFEKYQHKTANYLSRRVRLGSAAAPLAQSGLPTAYNAYEKYSNDLYNIRAVANYKKNFEDHKITAVGGFEFIYNENPYFFAEAEGFASEGSREPTSGAFRNAFTAEDLIANTYTFVGYFANANYAYKDKYLLGATVRLDGSSRYGAANKYIYTPAASIGWLLSREDFLKNSKLINLLKVRASYGASGNSGIGNYSSLERWFLTADSRYLQQPGIQIVGMGTLNLKPERTKQLDLGLDFEIVKSRISGAFDYYNRITDHLLLSYDAPPSAGVADGGLLLNAGKLRNRGIELSLVSKNITGKFSWDSRLTIARNKNEVLDLGGLTPEQVSSHKNITTYEGHPLGVFYLAEYAGVDPATGQELIYDTDANGNDIKVPATSAAQIDALRRPQFDKPSDPKFFGGVNNTFSYKNFDLSAFITFSYGNYVLDEGERVLSYLTGTNNLRETAADSWTPANGSSDFPRLLYNDPIAGSNTTRFLHDASYLRMKNITLGYSFKNQIKKLKFLKEARLFISAQNLFTVTSFPGWDPEVSGNYTANVARSLNQGITYMDVPQLRTFAAGFNLRF